MTSLVPPDVDPSSWEEALDPVENAFTIAMPRGWQNRAWLERRGAAAHNLAVAASPDGATSMFVGDARLPMFVEPHAVGFGAPPGAVVRPFTSIEHFLPPYAQERFGRLPGFRAVGMMPSRELGALTYAKVASSGAPQAYVASGRLAFELAGGGAPVRGLLFGSSVGLGGVWFVETMGLTTRGDPEAFVAALLGMYGTRKATPAMQQRQMQERAQNAAQHQATMASLNANAEILRSNHRANMANLSSMAASHQAHMASLHASHDASHAAWMEQQRAPAPTASTRGTSDETQRRFLNMIAEERTVVDGEGEAHQVKDGYDRYFRHRSDGTIVGTRNHADLYGIAGIDPNAFEELKIEV